MKKEKGKESKKKSKKSAEVYTAPLDQTKTLATMAANERIETEEYVQRFLRSNSHFSYAF